MLNVLQMCYDFFERKDICIMVYEKNIPLYIQVKNDIYNRIITNEYGEMLPTEKELIETYKVSRVTLRKALEKLEKEKIIIRKAGFGTRINRNQSELKNFTLVKSFTNEMKETGAKNTITFSSIISIVFADKHMAEIFNCDIDTKLYNLKRVRGVGEKAIVYSDTWLNLKVDLPTTKEFLFGSLYDFLIKNDIVFSRFEEELEAIMPDKEIRLKLRLEKDGAVLKRVRKGYDVDNNLLEYTKNYYDAKFYKYTVEVASIERVI